MISFFKPKCCRYCSTKLNEGILLFGDSGGSVYCLKFFATAGGLIDLNIGQQIPSGKKVLANKAASWFIFGFGSKMLILALRNLNEKQLFSPAALKDGMVVSAQSERRMLKTSFG